MLSLNFFKKFFKKEIQKKTLQKRTLSHTGDVGTGYLIIRMKDKTIETPSIDGTGYFSRYFPKDPYEPQIEHVRYILNSRSRNIASTYDLFSIDDVNYYPKADILSIEIVTAPLEITFTKEIEEWV